MYDMRMPLLVTLRVKAVGEYVPMLPKNVEFSPNMEIPLTLIGSDGYYSIGSIGAMKNASIPTSLVTC